MVVPAVDPAAGLDVLVTPKDVTALAFWLVPAVVAAMNRNGPIVTALANGATVWERAKKVFDALTTNHVLETAQDAQPIAVDVIDALIAQVTNLKDLQPATLHQLAKDVCDVVSAVRMRRLRARNQPHGALRRNVVHFLKTALGGAQDLARLCFVLRRQHFCLSDGGVAAPSAPVIAVGTEALQWMVSPADLLSVGNELPEQITVRACLPGGKLLIRGFGPDLEHKGAPSAAAEVALRALQQHLALRLPRYSQVDFDVKAMLVTLEITCSDPGLVWDLHAAVRAWVGGHAAI